jgi:hypothetical protein
MRWWTRAHNRSVEQAKLLPGNDRGKASHFAYVLVDKIALSGCSRSLSDRGSKTSYQAKGGIHDALCGVTCCYCRLSSGWCYF